MPMPQQISIPGVPEAESIDPDLLEILKCLESVKRMMTPLTRTRILQAVSGSGDRKVVEVHELGQAIKMLALTVVGGSGQELNQRVLERRN